MADSGSTVAGGTGIAGRAEPAGSGRLLSLDALRGFDMFWIVGAGALVAALDKLGGNAATRFLATQLQHVQWAGFHFCDLIFPLFVFIAGVSLVFSTDRTLARHSAGAAVARLARRCALLFALGVLYYGGVGKEGTDIRLLGVLQYIGLACFFGGSAYIALRSARAVAALCAVLLLGHGLLMEFAPFPDVRLDKASLAAAEARVGSREPSKVLATAPARVRGLYEEGRCFSNYVDYRYVPGRKINGAYESQPLLGVLGVVAACLLGVLAGLWMRRGDVSDPRKVAGLLAAGAVCVAIGAAVNFQVPVVKKLWSPSFILVAGGCSAMALGLFHAVIEVGQKRDWCRPFVWIGMNPIAIYLAHNVVSFPALAARIAGGDVQRFLDTRVAKGSGSLLLALVELALTFLLVRFLYVRKIFIKL